MEKKSQRTLNVLMLPWLGHGHVSPYFELAKKLTARNFKIHLCSTPATLSSIRSKITGKLSQSIKLVELHLSAAVPELPPNFHTPNGLPPHLMDVLKHVFDTSGPNAFRRILKNVVKPDLVIYDLLQPWAPMVSAEFGIPAVEFITCSATMASVMYHVYTTPDATYPFPDTIYYRDYESELYEKLVKGEEDARRVRQCIDRSSNIVLIKSFEEMEGVYMDYFSKMSGKKVVPVGPLVQTPNLDDNEQCEIMEWLNKKEKASTIFVSFGSEFFLSKKDTEEIAKGLEMSGVNFIWVVRFSKDQEDVKLEDILPKGFFKRVGNRGKVVNGWAPQAKILAHPNTGGFVSHCGWNSVLEGLKFGLPIVAMPMHLDQPVNARLLEDVGAGAEVVRDSDGNLNAREMAETIKLVVKESGGKSVRNKALDFQEKIELKGEEEIDNLVVELVKVCGGSTRANAKRKQAGLNAMKMPKKSTTVVY